MTKSNSPVVETFKEALLTKFKKEEKEKKKF